MGLKVNPHYGSGTYVVWKMHLPVPMCVGGSSGSCGLIFEAFGLENLRQLHSFRDYQVVWQSGPAIYSGDGTRRATKRDAAKPDGPADI